MWKRWAILCVAVVLAIVVLVGLFMPAVSTRGDMAPLVRVSRMRQLVYLTHEYAQDHGGVFPEASLWHEVMDPWLGIDRHDSHYGQGATGDFFLLPIPWSDGRFPSEITKEELQRTPFMYEDPRLLPGRSAIAFWDGSVRRVNDEEFAALIDTTRAIRLGRQEP